MQKLAKFPSRPFSYPVWVLEVDGSSSKKELGLVLRPGPLLSYGLSRTWVMLNVIKITILFVLK